MKITEEQLKAQFRTITNLFTEIEAMVVSRKKVNTSEIEAITDKWRLTQAGNNYLAELVKQSPFIFVQDEGDNVWLVAKDPPEEF